MRVSCVMLAVLAFVISSCVSPTTTPSSSSPPIRGIALLGSEPAVGLTISASFSQREKDCTADDPTITTSEEGRFEFARGAGQNMPRRTPIAGMWRICVSGPSLVRKVFQWPWVGDPASSYASMKCDFLKDDPCEVTWIAE
jgi:hypothetical protein